MSRNPLQMADLAQRYCVLIETSGTENTSWLEEIAVLFPRLQAAIDSFRHPPHDGIVALAPNLDARFELYSHLAELLGDRDSYRLACDGVDDSHMMTGSLADDLTDIYCELKHGLRMVDENPELSLSAWRESFTRHWSHHLADAERHLAALASQGRL